MAFRFSGFLSETGDDGNAAAPARSGAIFAPLLWSAAIAHAIDVDLVWCPINSRYLQPANCEAQLSQVTLSS
jgi:hypothetical protein